MGVTNFDNIEKKIDNLRLHECSFKNRSQTDCKNFKLTAG